MGEISGRRCWPGERRRRRAARRLGGTGRAARLNGAIMKRACFDAMRCGARASRIVFFWGRDQWDGEMTVDGGGIGSRAGDGGEAWAQVGWTGGEPRADIEYVCAGRGGGRGGLTRQSMGLKGGHRGGRRAVERSPGPEDRQGRTDRGASGEILWKEEGGQVDDD